mmetsp:Transcript_4986/g.8016  ORF Transcript_4986/g.8016 Transcript_4986/m.8016 type:complete len:442 (+) Transcript_4986:175-1500(+)|eukprot:CAMPEP_0184314586 /NCGR_PEP_ID=MMETSP1049-20130417/75572_1 /TAXON_ID=77928 /ORGANISM="Proteomonas sulcata, Strain CCMP704" /LENGTH=441 /DNA_ID=CAMNT_0026632581 /DNA_START=126 /DNA_END=1451 /DNA_ORIENTATION=-
MGKDKDDKKNVEPKASGAWPDNAHMPQCKACQRKGCSHFRRGFAHILSQAEDCPNPKIEAQKAASSQGTCDADILVPTTCPCHGCYDSILRVDLNRGPEKSLQYLFDSTKGTWTVKTARYRYKRDTELVVGCSGRHAIIESPKAGRYAQLWCRTCCNCEQSGKKVGKIAGCVDPAHWYTITNRSYHEKTPCHQLVSTLLVASYNEAVQKKIGFEAAIGSVGMSYYAMGMIATKEVEPPESKAANAAAMQNGQGNIAQGRGIDPLGQMQAGGAESLLQGLKRARPGDSMSNQRMSLPGVLANAQGLGGLQYPGRMGMQVPGSLPGMNSHQQVLNTSNQMQTPSIVQTMQTMDMLRMNKHRRIDNTSSPMMMQGSATGGLAQASQSTAVQGLAATIQRGLGSMLGKDGLGPAVSAMAKKSVYWDLPDILTTGGKTTNAPPAMS